MEKAGALGRAQPLVAIARVVVDVQGAKVERDVPRDVGAVDDRRDLALARPRAQLLDGKLNCRLRGDVAEEERARPVGDAAPDLLDGVLEEHGEPPSEELHGPALELALPCLVTLEHGPRAGAERPVVEEHDRGVEKEFVTNVCRVVHETRVNQRNGTVPSDPLRSVDAQCTRAPGRSVRARTGSRAPSPRSSASARSPRAFSSGAATATPRRRKPSSPASSRCTTRSCSATWRPRWRGSERRLRRGGGSASTATTTPTGSARRCWQCSSCGSSAPTSNGTCRAVSTRGTGSRARRSNGSPTRAAGWC